MWKLDAVLVISCRAGSQPHCGNKSRSVEAPKEEQTLLRRFAETQQQQQQHNCEWGSNDAASAQLRMGQDEQRSLRRDARDQVTVNRLGVPPTSLH